MMTKEPKFRLANRADLTAYAFACGYVQDRWFGDVHVQLYHEGACYHVKRFDHEAWNRCMPMDHCRIWDSFDLLSEARHRYRELVRQEEAVR